MNILCLGVENGTCLHRVDAMRRLGHRVDIVDPSKFVPAGRFNKRLHWETGYILCEKEVGRQILEVLPGSDYDLTWVDGGRAVGPTLIRELQSRFGPVINYNVDDPFGKRDRFSWSTYRMAVRYYDLLAVVRQENVQEAKDFGAKNVQRVYRSADEVSHAPRVLTPDDRAKWGTDVVFVGTGFENRGAFMAQLVQLDVPLTIYGDRWQLRPEWPIVKHAWKGPSVYEDDYAKAVQCSKLCLGLLSKANRDLHTTRTMEVPSLGGLFCAMRTAEHTALYEEGVEAVFWDDAKECAKVCKELLGDEERCRSIAEKGRLRNIKNGYFNEKIVSGLISEVMKTRKEKYSSC